MPITIPTTGSGTQTPAVATEVISATHYQQFKLIAGDVGSLAPLGNSATPIMNQQVGLAQIVGSIGVTQLLGPWTIIGSVQASIPNSFFALQANAPWTITGTVNVRGSIANSVLVSSAEPLVIIGGVALPSGALPASVGSLSAVQALFDQQGRQRIVVDSGFVQISSVTAYQGNPPWSVTGSVNATIIAGSAFASQAGSVPWLIVGSVFTSPYTVTLNGSTLIQSSLTVFQGAAPWAFTGSVAIVANSGVVVEGDTAAGSFDDPTFNPVKVGGYAVNSGWPTKVGSGTRTNFIGDVRGRQIVVNAPPEIVRHVNNAFTGPLSGTVVYSPGINAQVQVTNLRILAGSATSGIVGVYFARSGAPINLTVGSGTHLFYGEMAPSTTVKPGVIIPFVVPAPSFQNDSLRISLTTTMQVYLQVELFEI